MFYVHQAGHNVKICQKRYTCEVVYSQFACDIDKYDLQTYVTSKRKRAATEAKAAKKKQNKRNRK